MKHKLLFLIPFLFIAVGMSAQQRHLTVKDSLTNETLPYASINLLNGFGLFTDEKGEVMLERDAPKTIRISFVGYASKEIALDKVSSPIILLQPETNALSEVTVINTRKGKGKRKDFTVKPQLHDNINKMYWSSIGQQYAFYIPNTKKEGVLKSITIPLIVKDIHQGMTEDSFETDPYGTMVNIAFMTNANQLPDKKLNDYEKKVVIHSGKVTDQITVDFEEEIEIPEEGLFITMTIIGKTNKQGNYIPEMPYAIRELPDRKKKVIKIILPNYALVEAPKGQLTYFRNVFSDITKWERITRPMVYKNEKEYPFLNVGIGYTFSGY
ncbi:MAG: carboxypeptidase-like regulatory domain-containing protein [Flavobacterium sp.]|nr:MAG: carboxypeptidase-like regulatory domain-containing protein [Flavobacterium sp.]